ncbi:Rieske domain-containing protein-like [Littorina saxatilis]|uniref:Rieske domain-containing protein n=1 Tax=Littorina saxatilis TaxID=31220 RepID=A0AAN9GAJ4_9CAEN
MIASERGVNNLGMQGHDKSDKRVCVGTVQEILAAGRKRTEIADRDIVVIAHRGNFYALDSFCYHAGGPLHQGDIEDMGQEACIVCPWHKYKITLGTGQGLYMAVDPFNLKKQPELKSKGVKQRTHVVTIEHGQVFVTLSSVDTKLDSDHYNCAEYRHTFNLG